MFGVWWIFGGSAGRKREDGTGRGADYKSDCWSGGREVLEQWRRFDRLVCLPGRSYAVTAGRGVGLVEDCEDRKINEKLKSQPTTVRPGSTV